MALKTFGALHKSDVGGVALDLADDAALSLAYTAMAQSLGPAATVQPMVADGVEVSVGFVRDEAFGPLLVVAAGGTLVELLADRVVACPPVSHAGALALLDRLRIRPVLAGWRGAPAVDIDALADVIVAFSVMAIELGDVAGRRRGQSRHRLAARCRRGRRAGSGESGRILEMAWDFSTEPDFQKQARLG